MQAASGHMGWSAKERRFFLPFPAINREAVLGEKTDKNWTIFKKY
jgi:hypothetical protein